MLGLPNNQFAILREFSLESTINHDQGFQFGSGELNRE